MPTRPLRIALAQSCSSPGDVVANARTAVSTIIDAAAGSAQLVVFPELFLTGYELAHLAETQSAWIEEHDPRLDPIRRACADHGVTAVLGAAQRTANGDRLIAAPVIGPRGDVGTSYKERIHTSEAELFHSGTPLRPFEVNDWRVAIAICFDAAHPSHAERAALDGADVYICSALYVRGEERRSDLHFGARAMDNRMFAALANYAGRTGGQPSCGLSGVWGPSGEALVRTTDAEPALVVFDLDPAELTRYR